MCMSIVKKYINVQYSDYGYDDNLRYNLMLNIMDF